MPEPLQDSSSLFLTSACYRIVCMYQFIHKSPVMDTSPVYCRNTQCRNEKSRYLSFYIDDGLWGRCPELGLLGKSLNAAIVSVDIANEHTYFLTASPT